MYPVKLGYKDAVKRVRTLIENGHDAEALLTAMFTAEKTLYRTLRQLVISSGFPQRKQTSLWASSKESRTLNQYGLASIQSMKSYLTS